MATVMGTDYTKRRKDVLVVTVGTEEEPVRLSILPPTKGIYDGLLDVAETVDKANAGKDVGDFDLFDCLPLVARAMSHNAEARIITPEFLEEMGFDMSDVADFIGLYMFFIGELAKGKN